MPPASLLYTHSFWSFDLCLLSVGHSGTAQSVCLPETLAGTGRPHLHTAPTEPVHRCGLSTASASAQADNVERGEGELECQNAGISILRISL